MTRDSPYSNKDAINRSRQFANRTEKVYASAYLPVGPFYHVGGNDVLNQTRTLFCRRTYILRLSRRWSGDSQWTNPARTGNSLLSGSAAGFGASRRCHPAGFVGHALSARRRLDATTQFARGDGRQLQVCESRRRRTCVGFRLPRKIARAGAEGERLLTARGRQNHRSG